MIAREKRRIIASTLAKSKREQLKQNILAAALDFEAQTAAIIALQKCSRDESSSRVQRRCQVCGRPHAVYRKFGLCRLCLRQAAMNGHVPGLVKSSW